MGSRILKYSSLVWNILNKLFPGRKVPRGRTESAVPPLDSTLALLFLERWDCGVEESINFADFPGWGGCEMGVIFQTRSSFAGCEIGNLGKVHRSLYCLQILTWVVEKSNGPDY